MTRRILLIISREVRERMESQSFRLFTLGILLITGAAVILAEKADDIFGEQTIELGVAAEALPALQQPLQRNAALQDLSLEVVPYSDVASAEDAVRDGDLDAALIGDELVFDDEEDAGLRALVSRTLYEVNLPSLLEDLGLSAQDVQPLLNPEPAAVRLLQPNSNEGERRLVAFVATFVLYIFLAFYGNWILTGVIEEKASRVVEVLLGLVRPVELLAGKTLGILIVALIQMSSGVAGALAGIAITGSSALPEITLDVALSALTLGLLGTLLYSLMFATVGTTVSRQSDAQSAATPLTFLLLAPYLLAVIVVPDQPDSLLSVVLSLLPFTSPMVMPTRIAMTSPSLLELVLAYLLLLPAIAGVAWLGGRIYAGTILSSGRVGLWRAVVSSLRPMRPAGERG